MTQNLQSDIASMHDVFGHPTSEIPHLLDPARAEFRLKLIRSEVNELEEALRTGNLVEALDAIVDIMVVTVGTGVESGFPLQEAWDIVLASNLSKLGEDGKAILSRGEELDGEPLGKFLKGPNYWKPTEKLQELIQKQLDIAKDFEFVHESHKTYPIRDVEQKVIARSCHKCRGCTCHGAEQMAAPCDPTNYQAS